MTLRIMTFTIATLGLTLKFVRLCVEIYFIMLSVLMLSVLMLSVLMLSVLMLSVRMLSVLMLSVLMLTHYVILQGPDAGYNMINCMINSFTSEYCLRAECQHTE
jgi:hypothetical protein